MMQQPGPESSALITQKAYGDTILDPLPHDANYFSDHLLFAKNYFRKVSNGKLDIEYKVLPEVIIVSKTMRNTRPDTNLKILRRLVIFPKSWRLADQNFPALNFPIMIYS